ncbi:phosphotransferase family protein [Purpureocillium lilacinum]|uniref:Phosphotransferase family protein n=1 Tax=Purpureocillium lilacinum TaxID=33203 RepID=A0A179GHE4_PURLI|nr:phosphotransferase family protein [Purpureocillium lilacinum]
MAPTTDEKVQAAVSIVQQAQLPYPLDRLLESFVFEALNPRLAASFLQRHCHDGPTLHSDALSLVSDWKYIVESVLQSATLPQAPDVEDASMISSRDGMKCCITGQPGTRNDPLIVTPVLPLPVGWIQSSVGSILYDYEGNNVQRLPFGLFLKYPGDPGLCRNEFHTLQMIRKYTCMPAPRPLDIAIVASSGYLFRQKEYLLMTQMPGRQATDCYEELSDDEMTTFVQEMQAIVSQIRSIPKLVGDGYAICDSLGGPIRDHRIRDATPFGPFANEDGFNALLRNPDDSSRKGHEAVFTHADLNFRNILIDEASKEDGTIGWHVTGIVDWETAGFYPEYWEYTKMLFESFRYEERLKIQIHRIFGAFGDYSKEVEVEKRSWEEGDYI